MMSFSPSIDDLPPPPPGKTGWPWIQASEPLPMFMPDALGVAKYQRGNALLQPSEVC